MATRDFILDLGKLMIGIAWIDGRLEQDEINALKELLFLLPDISGEEWIQLELYMTHAVSDAERRDLLDRVLSGIRSSGDKQLVLETLEKLVGGDGSDRGIVGDAPRGVPESAFLDSIRQDIEGRSTGLLGHLAAPIRQTLKRKAGQGSREDRIEDFIKNTIYYQLTSELQQQGRTLSIPVTEARKVCLAAGLMAHVAWVDNEVCHREREAMSLALRELWNVPADEARLITEMSQARIMHGLDLVRLTSGFCHHTTIEERKAFLRCLFAIANAAENTSHAEIEAIRQIAKSFELPHQEFIEAKLTIPRQDRGGL
ncbi:MAG: TerB family tellurite resistance protein [Nitrospira sp.]|nr:TerB family tellurite resistance protein [Nitrospira sp.]MCY4132743.1 TerB family tellurite resistance protein [Nitrospira sp.]